MNTAREKLLKIIDEFPEKELTRVLNFAESLKEMNVNFSKDSSKELENIMESWDNDIDEEVWNYL
ncbi:MAG: DUF2281 domain-containing protein [Bacillota bacterium]|nr:DUF2281 domain-containing protein [Bacillota bacterium]